MKKLLLSLGTVASAIAPIATVVACGSDSDTDADKGGSGESTVKDGLLTIDGIKSPEILDTDEEEEIFAKISAFINLLAVQKLTTISDSDKESITKINIKGEADFEGQGYESFEYNHDFADINGYDNFKEAYDAFKDLEEDGRGFTGLGQLVLKLISDDWKGDSEGEIDSTPELVTAKILGIEALTITSTFADFSGLADDASSITSGEAEGVFGIEAAVEYKKITGIFTADIEFAFLQLVWDKDAEKINVEFSYQGTTYDAAIGTIEFTEATPAA